VPVEDGMLVVDIGSGAFPNPRADVLCDRELTDNRHRSGMAAVVDRPFVVADVTALPFRGGSIDFAIVSHLAEHVADLWRCATSSAVSPRPGTSRRRARWPSGCSKRSFTYCGS
jgi:hypothetical protein